MKIIGEVNALYGLADEEACAEMEELRQRHDAQTLAQANTRLAMEQRLPVEHRQDHPWERTPAQDRHQYRAHPGAP